MQWKYTGRMLLNGAMLAIGLVGVLFLLYGFYRAVKEKGLGSSDAAGWIQAAGSVMAVLIAVYVSNLQHRNDLRRDEVNDHRAVTRLVQSLVDELEVVTNNFRVGVGAQLSSLKNGEYFRNIILLTENRFPVYRTYIAHIGDIPVRELRREIIRTYTAFEIFILEIGAHNSAVLDHREFVKSKDSSSGMDRIEITMKEGGLAEKSHGLAESYRRLDGKVALLISALNAFLNHDDRTHAALRSSRS